MFSKFSVLILAFAFLPLMASAALAGSFKWSTGFDVKDSLGYSRNTGGDESGSGGTAGMFAGTLAGYYQGETKVVGFGGVLLLASSRVGDPADGGNIAFAVSGVPITFMDDAIQIGVGRNVTDDSMMLTVGLSLKEILGKGFNLFD